MAFKAGEIVFEIKGDIKGLNDAMSQASASVQKGFGNVSQFVGTAMTGAGLAITGFAGVAIKDFIDTGSAINDMALRTGFGVEALQEFGYAAGLSGGSMDDVEKAAKKMSMVIFGAGEEAKVAGEKQAEAWAKGGKEVVAVTGAFTDSLAALGLNYAQLKGMKPEEQFTTIGFALADISDATERAALAQQFFGRAGTSLLPMLSEGRAGFQAMADEAKRLGLIMDAESVAAADKLGDEMDKLRASLKGLGFDVAEALIPALGSLVEDIRGVMDTFSAWRDSNPRLFDSITKIVVVVGAVMAVLGPLLIMLPGLVSAWTLLSGAVTIVGSAFAALGAIISAPVALVVGGIAAIVSAGVALWYYWDQIKSALVVTWQAISDAWFFIWGPIIDGITWLASTGLSVLQKAASFVGIGGGAQGRQDAPGYNGQQQGRGFGGMALAGAGGGGAAITMNFNISGATDPGSISRTIAEQLRLELRARGI